MQPNSTLQTEPSQLVKIINSVIDAMKQDFKEKFFLKFTDDSLLRGYKNEIYKEFNNFTPEILFQAYDVFLERISKTTIDYPPSVTELSREAEKIVKCQEKETQVSENNPVEIFNKVKYQADEKTENGTHREWLHRKKGAMLANEVLVGSIGRKFASSYHLCHYPECCKSGALTSNIRGSEHWYCIKHLRET